MRLFSQILLCPSTVGKELLPFTRGGITPQQLLLLQQTAIQHQQQQQQQLQHKQQQQHHPHTQLASSHHLPTQPAAQIQLGTTPQAVQLAQKIQLPASIEQQLRTAIPLTAQRVANISSVVRGSRTDEVLALLRQQSLRMAATQSAAAKLHQSQAAKDPSLQAAPPPQNITISSAAAAAAAVAAVQQQQQQQQQAPKPSVVSPAESMKIPENISLGQLKVEKLDQSQLQRPPTDKKQ